MSKPVTDFPSKGENKKISFSNSEYPEADYAYCMHIKKNYPELWAKGGNVRGNDAFKYWGKIRKGIKTPGVLDWMREREAWFARHYKNKNVPGIIAWLKWGGYGHHGEAKIKQILKKEMDKIDKKKTKRSFVDKTIKTYSRGDNMRRKSNRLVQEGPINLPVPEHRQKYYDECVPDLDKLYPNRNYEVHVDSNKPIQQLIVDKINESKDLSKLFPESKSRIQDRKFFPYRSGNNVSRIVSY